jgi:hypothetical protein
MTDPRPSPSVDRVASGLARRARRGLIAGYIHELSERHNTEARDAETRAERARPRGSLLSPEPGETLA